MALSDTHKYLDVRSLIALRTQHILYSTSAIRHHVQPPDFLYQGSPTAPGHPPQNHYMNKIIENTSPNEVWRSLIKHLKLFKSVFMKCNKKLKKTKFWAHKCMRTCNSSSFFDWKWDVFPFQVIFFHSYDPLATKSRSRKETVGDPCTVRCSFVLWFPLTNFWACVREEWNHFSPVLLLLLLSCCQSDADEDSEMRTQVHWAGMAALLGASLLHKEMHRAAHSPATRHFYPSPILLHLLPLLIAST